MFIQRLVGLVLRLVVVAAGLVFAALLLAVGLVLTVAVLLWGLLRGRRPTLWRFAFDPKAAWPGVRRQAPSADARRQAAQGDVVDVEARVVPEPPSRELPRD